MEKYRAQIALRQLAAGLAVRAERERTESVVYKNMMAQHHARLELAEADVKAGRCRPAPTERPLPASSGAHGRLIGDSYGAREADIASGMKEDEFKDFKGTVCPEVMKLFRLRLKDRGRQGLEKKI